MSDQEIAAIASTLSSADREEVVMRYWRRGDLTPLRVANSLAQRRPQVASCDESQLPRR